MKSKSRYTIIGRCLDGIKVKGYILMQEGESKPRLMAKDTVEKFVMDKRVTNCTGQTYDNKIVLKGVNCKLVDLPSYTPEGKLIVKEDNNRKKKQPYLLLARLMSGRNILGYVVGNVINKSMRVNLDRNRVLELAKNGEIQNARVQKLNDKLILRGVGCELSQLPTIKI